MLQVLTIFIAGIGVGLHVRNVGVRPEAPAIALCCAGLAVLAASSLLRMNTGVPMAGFLISGCGVLWGTSVFIRRHGRTS